MFAAMVTTNPNRPIRLEFRRIEAVASLEPRLAPSRLVSGEPDRLQTLGVPGGRSGPRSAGMSDRRETFPLADDPRDTKAIELQDRPRELPLVLLPAMRGAPMPRVPQPSPRPRSRGPLRVPVLPLAFAVLVIACDSSLPPPAGSATAASTRGTRQVQARRR